MAIYLPAIALAVSTTACLYEERKYEAIQTTGRSASVGGPAHMRGIFVTVAIGIGVLASLVAAFIVRYNTGSADLAGYILATGIGISYTTTKALFLKMSR